MHTLSYCLQLPVDGCWAFLFSFLLHFKAVGDSEARRVFQDVLKWQHQAKAAEFAPDFSGDGTLLFQDSHFWNRKEFLVKDPVASSVASDRCECWCKSGLSSRQAWQLPPRFSVSLNRIWFVSVHWWKWHHCRPKIPFSWSCRMGSMQHRGAFSIGPKGPHWTLVLCPGAHVTEVEEWKRVGLFQGGETPSEEAGKQAWLCWVGANGKIKQQIHVGEGYFEKRKIVEFSTQNFVNALEDGINRYKQVNNMAVKISKPGDNTEGFLRFPSFCRRGADIIIISCGNRIHSLGLCWENLPVTPVLRTMQTYKGVRTNTWNTPGCRREREANSPGESLLGARLHACSTAAAADSISIHLPTLPQGIQ